MTEAQLDRMGLKWVAFTTTDGNGEVELGLNIGGVVVGLYKGDRYFAKNVAETRAPKKHEFGTSLYPVSTVPPEVWLAAGYTDEEGRYPPTKFAAFPDKQMAYDAAKLRYGGYAASPDSLLFFRSIEEWKEGKNERLKAQALSKLTPEERRALRL